MRTTARSSSAFARGHLDDEVDAVGGDLADRRGGVVVAVVDDVVGAGGGGQAAFAGPLTVVITVAPAQRASWIAAWPTAPAPPATSTTLPARAPGCSRRGPSSATVRARWAVMAGTPRLAPTSKPTPSGSADDPLGRQDGELLRGAGGALVAGEIHSRRGRRRRGRRPRRRRRRRHPAPSWFGVTSGKAAAARAGAAAGLPVGGVDARDHDAHPDLAGAGFGQRALHQAQDGGGTGLGVDDRLHDGRQPPGAPPDSGSPPGHGVSHQGT